MNVASAPKGRGERREDINTVRVRETHFAWDNSPETPNWTVRSLAPRTPSCPPWKQAWGGFTASGATWGCGLLLAQNWPVCSHRNALPWVELGMGPLPWDVTSQLLRRGTGHGEESPVSFVTGAWWASHRRAWGGAPRRPQSVCPVLFSCSYYPLAPGDVRFGKGLCGLGQACLGLCSGGLRVVWHSRA